MDLANALAVQRTLWMHVGMHKTGTTALQLALAENRERLLEAGICYPLAGQDDATFADPHPRHGLVVRELRGALPAGARSPIDAIFAEIDAARTAAGCISVEGLSSFSRDTQPLIDLRERAVAAGFLPRIVIYLRPQADYLESLYPQLLTLDYSESFDTFVRTAVRDGEIVRSPAARPRTFVIDYARLLAIYAGVFGKDDTIVRGYRSDRDDAWIFRDFLQAVDVRTDAPLSVARRINTRLTAAQADALLARNRAHREMRSGPPTSATASSSTPPARFQQLRLRHVVTIAARVAVSNARVWSRYGVRIAPISAKRLRALLATTSA